MQQAETRRDADELQQIEAAQRRLADGTYGVCEDCGEAIDLRRLVGQSTAARCTACQAMHEHMLHHALHG